MLLFTNQHATEHHVTRIAVFISTLINQRISLAVLLLALCTFPVPFLICNITVNIVRTRRMLQGQPTDPRHTPLLKTDPQHDLAAQFRTMESVRNRKERSRGQHSGFINWLRKTQCIGFPQFVHVNAGQCLKSADERLLSLVTAVSANHPRHCKHCLTPLHHTCGRSVQTTIEPTGSDTKW